MALSVGDKLTIACLKQQALQHVGLALCGSGHYYGLQVRHLCHTAGGGVHSPLACCVDAAWGAALQRVALPSILGDGIPSPQNWIFAALPVLIGGALLDKASSSASSFLLKAVTHNQRSKNSSSEARLSRLSPPV